MPTLLLFNIPPWKRARMQVLAIQCAVKVQEVRPGQTGNTLNDILSGAPDRPAEEPFTEEMLVMAGLNGKQMDMLLAGLRRQKIPVELKAVVTPTNANWTAQSLYAELCRERAAFAAGKKAHP